MNAPFHIKKQAESMDHFYRDHLVAMSDDCDDADYFRHYDLEKVTLALFKTDMQIDMKLELSRNRLYFESYLTECYKKFETELLETDSDRVLKMLHEWIYDREWISSDYEDVRTNQYLFSVITNYQNGTRLEHTGIFDRAHVSKYKVKELAQLFQRLISGFEVNDIFKLTQFDDAIKKDEIMFCKVVLLEQGVIRYYRAIDLEVKKDDLVVISGESNNCETRGLVLEVEYYKNDMIPYYLEDVGEIVRCTRKA